MKDFRLELRLSERDFNLIKTTADRMNLTVSKLILSLLIPYCLSNCFKINEKYKSCD